MQVWLSLDMNLDLAEVAAHARRAEALGCDVVTLADVTYDALLGAQAAIAATSRVTVATSGLVCFARSPLITAMGAWNLAALSAGRFRLGLSSLVPQILSGRYGVPWQPAASRMREYLGALRAIWSSWQDDVPLDFAGEHYRLNRQNSWTKPKPLESGPIPVHLGAIGPLMSRLVGTSATALLTHPVATTPRYIDEVSLPRIREGERSAGRPAGSAAVIATTLYAGGSTWTEAEAQREQRRRMLATNLSTPHYWGALESYGWKSTGERLRELVREGRWDQLGDELSPEQLDTFVTTATWDGLAGELRRRFEGRVDGFCLTLPASDHDDARLARVIRELRD